MRGRFEYDGKRFNRTAQDIKTGAKIQFSLKKLFPDYFAGSNKAPRLLMQVARDVMDSHFSEEGGFYSTDKTPEIDLFYKSLPTASAKVKSDQLARKIKEIMKKATTEGYDSSMSGGNSDAESQQSGAKKVVAKSSWQKGSGLSKTLAQGFQKADLNFSDLNMLADRLIQQVYFTPPGKPLSEEVWTVGRQKQKYYPLWDSTAQQVIGSIPLCAGLPKPNNVVNKARYDLVNLVATYMKAMLLIKNRQKGIIFLPVDCTIFKYSKLAELYTLLISRLHPGIKKIMCLELRGLTKEEPGSEIRENISKMSEDIGAIALETDVLFPFMHNFDDIRIFATGCSMTKARNMHAEPYYMLQKLSEFGKSRNKEIYVKNVKDKADLDFLKEQNIRYISGPALGPAQSKCIPSMPLKV